MIPQGSILIVAARTADVVDSEQQSLPVLRQGATSSSSFEPSLQHCSPSQAGPLPCCGCWIFDLDLPLGSMRPYRTYVGLKRVPMYAMYVDTLWPEYLIFRYMEY